MPRAPRGDRPGEIYHLYPRGVNRCAIFCDHRDRFFFMKALVRTCRSFDLRVLAFVLMTNHVHLVVRRGEIELGHGMKSLLGRHAQFFNRRHGRVGHLFQNRYGASLVDTDSYLVHLIRYVHANPVRAGIVKSARQYRDSSFRWYARSRGPGWADLWAAKAFFGSDAACSRFFHADDEVDDRREMEAHAERSRTIRRRCGEREEEKPPTPTPTPEARPRRRVLRGDAEQLAEMLALRAALERSHGLDPGSLTRRSSRSPVSAARAEFAATAILLGGIPPVRVARFLGVTRGRVSQYILRKRSD